MSGQPQTIAKSLMDRMASYQFVHHIPPLVLAGFERDAKSLLKDCAPIAFAFQGMVAALAGRTESVIFYFDKALSYGSSAIIHYNFAVSLLRVGYFEKAAEQFKKSAQLADPLDIDTQYLLLDAFTTTFAYKELNITRNNLINLGRDIGQSSSTVFEFLARQSPEHQGILEQLILRVKKLISKHQLFIKARTYFSETIDGINIIYPIESSNDETLNNIVECNFAISDLISEFESEFDIDLLELMISCEATE